MSTSLPLNEETWLKRSLWPGSMEGRPMVGATTKSTKGEKHLGLLAKDRQDFASKVLLQSLPPQNGFVYDCLCPVFRFSRPAQAI